MHAVLYGVIKKFYEKMITRQMHCIVGEPEQEVHVQ